MTTATTPGGGGTAFTTTAFIDELTSLVGKVPYVYGGNSLKTGTDCAGLVQLVLAKFGVTAPRTSEQQYQWATPVTRSQLQPGDLVFMQFPGDNAPPGHVEVYIGNGQVLGEDDPSQGLAITSMKSVQSNSVGYGRVPNIANTGAGSTNATTTSFDGLDPSTWGPAIASGLLSGLASSLGLSSVNDLFERLGLILLGGVLIIVGIVMITRPVVEPVVKTAEKGAEIAALAG